MRRGLNVDQAAFLALLTLIISFAVAGLQECSCRTSPIKEPPARSAAPSVALIPDAPEVEEPVFVERETSEDELSAALSEIADAQATMADAVVDAWLDPDAWKTPSGVYPGE